MIAVALDELKLSMSLAEPAAFPVVEKVLLTAVIVASLGVFAWRLRPIAWNVWESKKDTDFPLRPVGGRVWDFFWEVLCQAKVIRAAASAGAGARICVLGILCVRAGDAESLCGRVGRRISCSMRERLGHLRSVCCGVGAAGCGQHCRLVCAAVCGEAEVAGGEGFGGVGRDCGADFSADGDVSCGTVCGRWGCDCVGVVVGAHAGAAGVSADYSWDQASAPGVSPLTVFLEAAGVFAASEAGGG